MQSSEDPRRLLARKAGSGCMGCLWQTGIVLALGGVLLIAMIGVFQPWAFYLGGKFHILPYWQGWGTAHAKSGDYLFYVRVEPSMRGQSHVLVNQSWW